MSRTIIRILVLALAIGAVTFPTSAGAVTSQELLEVGVNPLEDAVAAPWGHGGFAYTAETPLLSPPAVVFGCRIAGLNIAAVVWQKCHYVNEVSEADAVLTPGPGPAHAVVGTSLSVPGTWQTITYAGTALLTDGRSLPFSGTTNITN